MGLRGTWYIERHPRRENVEAMRLAVLFVMSDRSRPGQWTSAHPAVWAPFVVVGEAGTLTERGNSAGEVDYAKAI